MSQYGARGRALAGQDARTILAHYYAGTSAGTIHPATPIRVLVLSRFGASPTSPLVLHGRVTMWRIDGVSATFPADARLTLKPTTTTTPTGTTVAWSLRVTYAGQVLLRQSMSRSFRIRSTAAAGRLQLDSKPSSFDRYRSVLRVLPSRSAAVVSVVNELRLETYLRGVVPAEMPSTWPAAGLQAQAIVARSYAARHLRPGVGSYDIGDTSASQVYRGSLAERSTTNSAITTTSSAVLMSGSSIANTLYHSTAGGATENNENAFVSPTGQIVASPVAYLRGWSDRTADGTPYDADAPAATWQTATYTMAQLSGWLAKDPRTNVGTLATIDLSRRGVSGRLISVTLGGSGGKKTVSGEVFRAVFNANRPTADPSLRSTLFDLAPIP